jgi:hypothetical protein
VAIADDDDFDFDNFMVVAENKFHSLPPLLNDDDFYDAFTISGAEDEDDEECVSDCACLPACTGVGL